MSGSGFNCLKWYESGPTRPLFHFSFSITSAVLWQTFCGFPSPHPLQVREPETNQRLKCYYPGIYIYSVSQSCSPPRGQQKKGILFVRVFAIWSSSFVYFVFPAAILSQARPQTRTRWLRQKPTICHLGTVYPDHIISQNIYPGYHLRLTTLFVM